MRIAIVNQFAPPDEAPTAVLAGELHGELRALGHDVTIIACNASYRKGKRMGRAARIFSECVTHVVLLLKMLFSRQQDLILCLTTPTCLPATAALAALLRRSKFSHWAMDVYPEVAVQLGEIRRGGITHRITEALMNWAYRRADLLVALDEDMQQFFKSRGFDAVIHSPWAPTHLRWPTRDDRGQAGNPKLRWLYSGNLGRAHAWEAILEAQSLLEKEHPGEFELVFQGGGASRDQALLRANELKLKDCTWAGYAPKDSLLTSLFQADVLIASQNPRTKGLLWPSKLAVMQFVPRHVLWLGPSESAISEQIRSRQFSMAVDVGPKASGEIAEWLKRIRAESGIHQIPYQPPTSHQLKSPVRELAAFLVNHHSENVVPAS